MRSLITHPTGLQALFEGIIISFVTFHLSWMCFFPLIILFIIVSIIRLCLFMSTKCMKKDAGKTPCYKNPKCVFITGGGHSKGIGYALAKQYILKGATTIILTDINETNLNSTRTSLQQFADTYYQQQLSKFTTLQSTTTNQTLTTTSTTTTTPQPSPPLPIQIITHIADVTDRHKMSQLLYQCNELYHIDIVIANAGIQPLQLSHLTFEEMTRKVHDVNVNGVMNTIFPLQTTFRQRQNGQFIILSSASSMIPLIGTSYPSTKAWATQFGRCLRQELAFDNVSVVTITPGFVDTDLLSTVSQDKLFWKISADELAQRVSIASENDESLCIYPTWRYKVLFQFFSVIGHLLVDYIGGVIKIREKCSDLELPSLTTNTTTKTIKCNNDDNNDMNNNINYIQSQDNTPKEKLTIPNSDSIKSNNTSFQFNNTSHGNNSSKMNNKRD